jgi:hypothetical protein
MVYFQTKNPNLGNFVIFVVFWYIFGMLYQEKSGNTATNRSEIREETGGIFREISTTQIDDARI